MLKKACFGILAVALMAATAQAAELDLTVQVKTARPTTVSPVKYRIDGGGGSAYGQTQPGEDGTTPVTMTFHVQTPASCLLYTPFGPVYGQFGFSVAEDGTISTPDGSPLTVSGTTFTLENDVDLPDFGVRMREPTTLSSVTFMPHAAAYYQVRGDFEPKSLSGPDADTALRWPILGVMEGTRISVTTPLGRYFSAVVTADGGLTVDDDPAAIPASVDASDPEVLVVENDVDLDGFAVLLDRPTSLRTLTYRLASAGSFFPGLDGAPGNPAIPGEIVVSNDVADVDAARFPLHGLVPGQIVTVKTRLGSVDLQVAPDSTLVRHSGSLPFTFDGSVLVVDNSIDIPDFEVRADHDTNATTIGVRLDKIFGDTSTGEESLPASEVVAGFTIPILGATPGLLLDAQTSFARASLEVTESGGVVVQSQQVPGSCDVVEEDGHPVLLLHNPYTVRLRTYGESPVTEVNGGEAAFVSAGVSSFWMIRIDPGTHNIGEKQIDGGDWTTGLEFQLEGMGHEQVISVSTYYGSNNAYHVPFRLEADGTATFLAPARQITPWLGALDVDANKDGVDDNVCYVELAPRNTAPTATLSTGNFSIPSSAQTTTELSASVADADGDALTCRWYVDDVLVVGPAAPVDGESSLDLGDVTPLAVGTHTVRFEVSDGELSAEPAVVITVENSPPVVVAGGSGVYEIGPGSDVTLTGTVADFDGDQLTWEWRRGDGTVLASGVLDTVAGGDPVAVPATTIGTQDLGLGVHTLTLAVEDELNSAVLATADVEVEDTTAPTLAPTADRTLLWPPKHEMIAVTVQVDAFDASGGPLTYTVDVASDEPPEFDGSGNFLPDHEVVSVDPETGEILLHLRAERAGKGDGRVYTVVVTATDASGNASSAEVEVVAPHDRGSN